MFIFLCFCVICALHINFVYWLQGLVYFVVSISSDYFLLFCYLLLWLLHSHNGCVFFIVTGYFYPVSCFLMASLLRKNDWTQFFVIATPSIQCVQSLFLLIINGDSPWFAITLLSNVHVYTKPAEYKYKLAKLCKQYCYQKYYLFYSHFTSLQSGIPLTPPNVNIAHDWLSRSTVVDWVDIGLTPGNLNWARKRA